MATLEVFVEPACPSEHAALMLSQAVQQEFPCLQVEVWQAHSQRARQLGLCFCPAFVLDGTLLAAGVPSKTWLVRRLRELGVDGLG